MQNFPLTIAYIISVKTVEKQVKFSCHSAKLIGYTLASEILKAKDVLSHTVSDNDGRFTLLD